MLVNHKKKLIVANHWEQCSVANFLLHCVKSEPGWSVEFLDGKTQDEYLAEQISTSKK